MVIPGVEKAPAGPAGADGQVRVGRVLAATRSGAAFGGAEDSGLGPPTPRTLPDEAIFMIHVTEYRRNWASDVPNSADFVSSATKVHLDFTVPKNAGRVLTRCPPSSVVERVLGKNEVTGSIPVGGSEWNGPRLSLPAREP